MSRTRRLPLPSKRRLSILLLCDDDRRHAANLLEHVAAFRRFSRHDVRLYNPRGVPRSRFLDLDEFDVVAIHYSLVITSDLYVAPWLRERIRAFGGLKIQFLQDEYRWVDDVTSMMRHLGVDVLFSIVPERSIDAIYGGRLPGVEIVPTLAGFVSDKIVGRRVPPIRSRAIDVGYRGRVLPYWIGALSQEKIAIAKGFLAHSGRLGLRCDIAWSENDRLYGRRWVEFLTSCRTTLGTESGASITDFDGSIERATLAYLEQRPGASFEEVFEHVLAPHEGNVMMNVVSPRIFEAAALRTGLVLFPGEYGGVIEPGRHYVPLEKDFSNVEEVADAIRDVPRLEAMTERVHEDVVESGRYSLRTFVEGFDELISARVRAPRRRAAGGYRRARLERPFETKHLLGHELEEPIHATRRVVATIGLLRRDAELRRLALAYAGCAEVRRRFGLARLVHDLLRLGIVRAAHVGRPVTTEWFSVVPSFDPDGTLTFRGRPSGGESEPTEPVDAAGLISEGRVTTVLWDHSPVGGLVFVRRRRRGNLGLQVGYHGLLGIYYFGVVSALAEKAPETVGAALDVLAREPGRRIPRGSAAPGRRRLRDFVVPALLLARAVLEHPPRVRLLLAAAQADGPATAAEDVVKLFLVHRAWAGRVGTVARVDARLEEDGRVLRLATAVEGIEYLRPWRLDRSIRPERVIWDNSAVGPTLQFPLLPGRTVAVGIGPDGGHEFQAVQALFRSRPDAAWRAVLPPEPRRRELHARGSIALRRTAVLLSALSKRRSRRLLALYARSGHSDVSLRRLVAELVKLDALAAARAGRLPGVEPVGVELDDGSLRFAAGAPRGLTATPDDPPAAVVWETSSPGEGVAFRGLTLAFPPSGIASFDAVARLLRHAVRGTWQALLPLESAPAGTNGPPGTAVEHRANGR